MISLAVQRDMDDFAWGSISWSTDVSRYTCDNVYWAKVTSRHNFLISIK